MGAGWTPPYPDPLFDPRKEIIHLTEQVIREAAASGNVVIVGRGAGFVLRDNPDVFRVFLRAPETVRVRTLMDRFGLTEAEARRRMHETDSNRAAYIKQLYGHDWCDPDEYDLVVNTGRIGYQASRRDDPARGGRARSGTPRPSSLRRRTGARSAATPRTALSAAARPGAGDDPGRARLRGRRPLVESVSWARDRVQNGPADGQRQHPDDDHDVEVVGKRCAHGEFQWDALSAGSTPACSLKSRAASAPRRECRSGHSERVRGP